MIIDCHGYYTTAPAPLEDWRSRQIAAFGDRAREPPEVDFSIGDDPTCA